MLLGRVVERMDVKMGLCESVVCSFYESGCNFLLSAAHFGEEPWTMAAHFVEEPWAMAAYFVEEPLAMAAYFGEEPWTTC